MATEMRNGQPCMPIGPIASPMDFSGTAEYGLYAAESTQRHALGRRALTWDGKVYKYTLANGTLNTNQGCEQLRPQEVSFAAIVSGALGATDLICTVGATDGVAGDGVIAENGMSGGNFVIFDGSASQSSIRRSILGNSAVDGANPMTIYFDAPLQVLLTTGDSIEAHSSPYLNITAAGSSNRTILGIPVSPATSGQYSFIQTWGICWVSPQADVGTVTAGSDQLVFRHDGTVEVHDAGSATTKQAQHAGFVMTWGQGGPGGQGAPFIMLQISI